MASDWISVAVGAVLAFGLSFGIVRIMLATGFALSEDVPNERSMHTRVIPRGGGLAFVVATVACLVVLGPFVLQSGVWVWYIVPFCMMAILGWLDDRFGLGIATRFVVQTGAASLVAFFLLEGTGDREFGIAYVAWFAVIVAVVVWVTNLYNFMDGMDGLAASQGVVVPAVMAIWFANAEAVDAALFCVVLAAAVAGFLVVNWHPAKVFMGDAGSLALGIVIAALSFDGVIVHDMPGVAFILLMGVFLFDATFTLLRRFLRGERWWQSHRSHWYQRARAAGFTQPRVVASVIGMDIFLAILASLLVFERADWAPVVIAAAVVLAAPATFIARLERRAAG